MRVRLLGGFDVTIGARIIPDSAWRTRKARHLFKILCLSPKHQMHRDELVDLLWPEGEPELASGNLRSTLHAVRRALASERSSPSSSCLHLRRDVLALEPPGGLEIDVEAFSSAAEDAFNQHTSAHYRAAIEHYTGDLLPEDRYEDWAVVPREALKETWIRLLISLSQLHESRGEYASGITELERIVAVDVTREDAHAGLMRMYALSGRPGQALRQYERLKDGLARELDVEPSVTSQRLHAGIAAGRFPVEGTLAPPVNVDRQPVRNHNLPAPLTSFIGRRAELDGLRAHLRTSRLITLTGVGGTGKSRLALELARGAVETFPDGVWLVELAALSDPALIPATVAGETGVREHPDHSTLEMLIEALRERELLLVIDNCEHLIEACASLIQSVLEACPQVHIVATSREPLRVPGEVNWRVAPLSLPSAAQGTPPEQMMVPAQLLENEAIAMFVDRVRWVKPGFALTAGNAPAVAQICQRLDGLPLALELAAARASVLAPEQLAERLDDALGLLSGGSRGASDRQRTLRSTLDWSYALLDQREQMLLRGLAVFAGGWTLDAVESVCAWHGDKTDNAPGIDRADVLPLLAQLVDKSLVQVEETDPGDARVTGVRYRLLETVRQYATEKLVNSTEVDSFRKQHASFHTALAEEADDGLKGAHQVQWLERMSADHDNVRAALAWGFDHDAQVGARLAAAMWRFWYTRDHCSEGREWLARAIALSDSFPADLRAAVLRAAGALAWSQGHYDTARAMAEESVALYRDLGNTKGLLQALSVLGTTLSNQGEYELAKQVHEESLALDRKGGNAWNLSRSLGDLGELAFAQGDYDSAQKYWQEGLELDRELEDTRSFAITSNNIGEVLRARGDFVRAEEHFSEALCLFQELDFKFGTAVGLSNMADIHLRLGQNESAAKLLLRSIAASRELKHPTITAAVLEITAALAATQQQGQQAVLFLGAADALRASSGIPRSPAEQAIVAPWIELTRSLLSDAAWSAAFEEGQLMSAELACEKADETATLYSVVGEVSHLNRPLTALTRREREVSALLAQGHTNSEIATLLGMARPTADKHVSNILHKLGFTSRTDVQAWASAQGLAPDDTTSS